MHEHNTVVKLSKPLCFGFACSSRLGDSEDLPDIRIDAASPGPRVTFNIQDSVRITLYHIVIFLVLLGHKFMREVHRETSELLVCFCVTVSVTMCLNRGCVLEDRFVLIGERCALVS